MAEPPIDEQEEVVEASEGEDGSASRSLVRRLLWPACTAVSGIVMAVVFCFFLFPPPAEPGEPESSSLSAEDHEDLAPPEMLPLPETIVNLADQGREVVLKVRLSVEFRAREPAEVAGRIEGKTTEIKDALITHLSGKISTEIKSAQGKELLKWELVDKLAPLLFENAEEGVLTNVFYEDLLLQ